MAAREVSRFARNSHELPAGSGLYLYLDPTQNFNGKAFALTSDGSGDYFISLSQTIISTGTAFHFRRPRRLRRRLG